MKKLNSTIKIGEINTLEIKRDTDFGFYLEAEDKSEVLLPNAYIIESKMPLNSLIDVFIYTDSEDRVVASTDMPYAKLGQHGFFKVVDTTNYGAFVDWGLPKDLFVPISQQKKRLEVGKSYILRVCLDEQTKRLYATQKIGKFINKNTKKLHPKKALDAIVLAKTPLGFKVIANNQYEGMLYSNEVFEKLDIGDKRRVYIKNIRSDGKLDLSLSAIGSQAKVDEAQSAILEQLKIANNQLPFTYKSDAQDIKRVFKISKKSFKKALTALIEAKEIELLEESIKKI